ncbi:MAG: hypothetical protein R6V58_16645 [Planctomycetota bacterium]
MEVTLTVAQVQRYQVIRAAIDRRMTNQEAAALRLSVRQVQRLKRRVEASGPAGVLQGNQGRDPPNKPPHEVRSKAIDLAMEIAVGGGPGGQVPAWQAAARLTGEGCKPLARERKWIGTCPPTRRPLARLKNRLTNRALSV